MTIRAFNMVSESEVFGRQSMRSLSRPNWASARSRKINRQSSCVTNRSKSDYGDQAANVHQSSSLDLFKFSPFDQDLDLIKIFSLFKRILILFGFSILAPDPIESETKSTKTSETNDALQEQVVTKTKSEMVKVSTVMVNVGVKVQTLSVTVNEKVQDSDVPVDEVEPVSSIR